MLRYGLRSAVRMMAVLGLVIATASGTGYGQDAGAVAYSINFVNNSGETGDFCVFQRDPDIGVDGVMTLAWFAERVPNQSTSQFRWGIDYSFVYGRQGKLGSGVSFLTTQVVPANLSSANSITFDFVDGTYSLLPPAKPYSAAKGSLVISQGPDVVKGEATVGVGMSGSGTFVVGAQPNQKLTFTPHPKYYVAFGNYKKGQIIDTQSVVGAPEIVFRGNNTSATVTLNPDNTWTITQD